MTIQNRPPALQPSAAPAFSGAILVSTAELAAVHEDVRRVSRRLNVIEDLSALGWEETDGICRAISRAARQLGEMLDGRKGGSLQ
jgi:hypothetical protein